MYNLPVLVFGSLLMVLCLFSIALNIFEHYMCKPKDKKRDGASKRIFHIPRFHS